MAGLLLLLAVMPVIIICTYIYSKDKNKEPWPLLIKLFLLGIASCFLVLFLSDIVFKIFPFMDKDTSFMSFFEVMAYSFIGVALIEEFCKFLMTFAGAYFHKAYDEVYDGIVYAVYVSLGFACLENILYVFLNQSIAVGISRGLLSVPGHACDAVFMGYYLSLAKVYASQGKKDLETKNIILSVVVPTILHGIYDFCLFVDIEMILLVFFAFVIALYVFSIKKIKLLAAQCKAPQRPVVYNNMQPQYQGAYQQYPQPQNYQQQNYQQQAGYVQQPMSQQPMNQQQTGFVQQPMNQQPMNQQQTGFVQQPQNQSPATNQYMPSTVPQHNNFCPGCGSPVKEAFCPNCGTKQV